jgi:hypothetical protein
MIDPMIDIKGRQETYAPEQVRIHTPRTNTIIDMKGIKAMYAPEQVRPPTPRTTVKRTQQTLIHQFDNQDIKYIRLISCTYVSVGMLSMVSIIMLWIFLMKLVHVLSRTDTIHISFIPK